MRAAIIDDEPDSIALLQLLLDRHCPEVSGTIAFTEPQKALEVLPQLKPDLLFLDIEMPGMNGFEFLKQCSFSPFLVIFITAYDRYAVSAFRFNAVDYLLKPIATDELKNAVAKANQHVYTGAEQLAQLSRQLVHRQPPRKIAVSSAAGISFVKLENILYAEASNNYSKLVLADGTPTQLVSKTLKEVQELLEEYQFLRVHRQYVVNLDHVSYFHRLDNTIRMSNNASIPVAGNQRDAFLRRYEKL